MIIPRIKQIFLYIFGKYNNEFNEDVKKILTEKEFQIFDKMDRYDKIHSYKILKEVMKDKILNENKIFFKLALLHDCGKENIGLLRRIKKVVVGDKKLSLHEKNGYEKLKNINKELAILIMNHHKKNYSPEMNVFQKIDDK
ncbi:MAG: HD domain-containing protein [Fusobacteriaceae bacterium]